MQGHACVLITHSEAEGVRRDTGLLLESPFNPELDAELILFKFNTR